MQKTIISLDKKYKSQRSVTSKNWLCIIIKKIIITLKTVDAVDQEAHKLKTVQGSDNTKQAKVPHFYFGTSLMITIITLIVINSNINNNKSNKQW